MSYFAFIDASNMTDPRAALLCARLHLRNGKRHLEKGFSSRGMVTLYDAVLFGMHYYIAKHKRCASLVENIDLWDAAGLFHVLSRAGVFDDPQAFNRFSRMVERALWQESFSFDEDKVLVEVEKMLSKLGVMPFNEAILQSELMAAC
jgi:2-hydroxychromene-2-carboxylate isomerase